MLLLRNHDQQLENANTQIHAFEIINQVPGPQDNGYEEDIPDILMNDDQF